jgi:cyclopropane-fatty-acyl-phospholipid synthase
MRRYMWPNSCLPSATTLIAAMNTGSQGRFTLEGVENHAARTFNSLIMISSLF